MMYLVGACSNLCSDYSNNVIRRIGSNGLVSTVGEYSSRLVVLLR